MGMLDKANFYHSRMMAGQKEPLESDLRTTRHNIFQHHENYIAKFRIMHNYAIKVYMDEIEKEYKNIRNLAEHQLRFFSSNKPNNAAITYRKSKPYKMVEGTIKFAKDPSDLSFLDLPSPHSNHDFNASPLFSKRHTARIEMDYKLKFERRILRCPQLVHYLHKRRSMAIRTKTQGRTTPNCDLSDDQRVSRECENSQIFVTHRSPSRASNHKSNIDTQLEIIIRSFMNFPNNTKYAALRIITDN